MPEFQTVIKKNFVRKEHKREYIINLRKSL